MENLPWSACYGITVEFHSKLLKAFGKHLWKIRHYDQGKENYCEKALRVFQQTPNLRMLIFYTGSSIWTSNNLPGMGKLNLRKLTHLEIDLTDASVQFLHYVILNGGTKLDYIFLTVDIVGLESAKLVGSLLINVPFISLIIDDLHLLNTLTVLTFKFLRDLQLELWDIETVEPVERFIARHSQHLEHLNLTIHSIPFKFPILPSLKTLNIEIVGFQRTSSNFTNRFLSLLETNQFPVLRKVYVLDFQNHPLFTEVLFPRNCHFDSVTELEIEFTKFSDFAFGDDWGRVFPNLKHLRWDMGKAYAKFLLSVFSYTSLEHLSLKIDISLEEGEVGGANINSLFSGISDPEAFYQKSEAEIEHERLLHGRPSILDLTSKNIMRITRKP